MMQVKKRDGRIVDFDQNKVTEAIAKAFKATTGKSEYIIANRLSDLVVKKASTSSMPSVEEIQDSVESVLMENGYSKVAKSYILYREKHNELRKEKQAILEKEEIDEVDKKFDPNALRVLKSRYLRKDEDGKLLETPKQLFTRVSVHTTLPNLMYDSMVFDKNSFHSVHTTEEFDTKTNHNVYSIGKYKLNMYHIEALKRMYDRMNKEGKMKISWSELLGILEQGGFDKYEKDITEFYNLFVSKQFVANTPAMANFGEILGMGSACFVIDVEDSIEKIMDSLKKAATIFKSGGGVGYNFSKLRPENDFVSTTCGVASGPISFMTLFDKMTEVIKQGGIRRGANMGILNSNHPDIEKFIVAKEGNKQLRNFNISVLIMGDFWDYYEKNEPYPLINPRSKKVVKTVNPRQLFDKIVYQAWESAEPGIIFFDKVNDTNPFYEHLGPIVTTNPCGEVLLYPNEPCNLGSINVHSFVKEDREGNVYYDWDELKRVVLLTTKFMDNVIDVNKFPLKEIEEMSLATRKIGLGVMGLGDLLYELGVPYNSEAGRKLMEKLLEFINYYSKVRSIELAQERGPLPFYDKSFYPQGRLPIKGFEDKDSWNLDWNKISEDVKTKGIRNGFTIVIAPTGSISMIAGCSSGIEPVYALAFEKNVKIGSFYYINYVLEKVLRERGLYTEELMAEIVKNNGSVKNILYLPKDIRDVFITALDTVPEDHIKALAACQKWVDSSISKTNNFDADATVEYMRDSYILAYKLGCKDVTVYRDKSIQDQALVAGEAKKSKENKPSLTEALVATMSHSSTIVGKTKFDYKECPECKSKVDLKEGCVSCQSCGWGLCA